MLGNRRIQLSAPADRGRGTGSDIPRFISDRVDARQLAEGNRTFSASARPAEPVPPTFPRTLNGTGHGNHEYPAPPIR